MTLPIPHLSASSNAKILHAMRFYANALANKAIIAGPQPFPGVDARGLSSPLSYLEEGGGCCTVADAGMRSQCEQSYQSAWLVDTAQNIYEACYICALRLCATVKNTSDMGSNKSVTKSTQRKASIAQKTIENIGNDIGEPWIWAKSRSFLTSVLYVSISTIVSRVRGGRGRAYRYPFALDVLSLLVAIRGAYDGLHAFLKTHLIRCSILPENASSDDLFSRLSRKKGCFNGIPGAFVAFHAFLLNPIESILSGAPSKRKYLESATSMCAICVNWQTNTSKREQLQSSRGRYTNDDDKSACAADNSSVVGSRHCTQPPHHQWTQPSFSKSIMLSLFDRSASSFIDSFVHNGHLSPLCNALPLEPNRIELLSSDCISCDLRRLLMAVRKRIQLGITKIAVE